MSSDQPPESKYPPLQKPDFKPNIPSFLTENASEQDRFIIEQISILSQYVKWSVDTQIQVHSQVRTTNGRLMKAEGDIGEIKADVGVLNAQAGAVAPFLKPISMFSALWEYRAFRWVFWAGIVFFLGILYPYYLQSSPSAWLSSVAKFFLGAP